MTQGASTQKHRIALVTGGMGGLGTAMCRHLAQAGMTVVATYSPDNAYHDQWLRNQRKEQFHFHAYCVDVRDFRGCENVANLIATDIGPIDVLVNNAGITRDASLRKMRPDDWVEVLRTNLDSVYAMSRSVIAAMCAAGWGRIINISSVNGQRGSFGQTNYCAAKAGIHGFTKALALEVAGKGVTVNTVSPGYMRTAMVAAMAQEVLNERILPQIPMGRLGEPDEVAAVVAFLAGDRAGYITGANIAINGGMHMY
ncbi:MAG: acetoacetyl-CoA reductase [Burkholderiaceae bacterium]|jgi:acetoacetyl-CoA reductase